MRAFSASMRPVRAQWLAGLSAVAVLAIAFEGGGYSLGARAAAAVAVWWAIVLAVLLGGRARVNWTAIATLCFLAGLTLWTGLSALWSSNAEASFAEFGRAVLYLGVFVLIALVVRRSGRREAILDGVAVAIAIVGVVALATRLFPSLTSAGATLTFLPQSVQRLAYPLNYWNGLAIFIAIGFPLLLRGAVIWRSSLARAAAVAALPPLSAAMYLTSSRGGFAALACGIAVFGMCADHRWTIAGAVLVAGVGGAAAINVLSLHPRLVDGPFAGPVVAGEGHRVALALAAISVAVGGAFLALSRIGSRAPRPSRSLEVALVGVIVVAVLVGIASQHPVRRFDAFTQPPSLSGPPQVLQDHLLSGGGTGRWQLWSAAARESDHRLLTGGGAGTFGEWWAAHGTLPLFVLDAHSLYLETLGELGLVGIVLLLGALLIASVGAVMQLRRGSSRVTTAAAMGAVAAYLLGAGVDWMWELPAVSAMGIALLGVLAVSDDGAQEQRPWARPLRLGVVAVAALAIACCAVPWIAQTRLDASQSAAKRGQLRSAYADALAARRLMPWAATPDVQAALVAEQARDLPLAQRLISRAIEHDRNNWSLWYIRGRILRAEGHSGASRRNLRHALSLNPHSAALVNAVSGP
ncbi:MAG: O-antigen ligase family protein [Gaiellaceae bacterium]